MKKILITSYCLLGVFAFSQHTPKKKHHRKKTAPKTIVKKAEAEKPSFTVIDSTQVKQEELPKVQEATQPTIPSATTEEVAQKIEAIHEDENTAEKLSAKVLKMKGWINNRNSAYVRGIEGFIKGVYSAKDKIFILMEIYNRTNIKYDIESASFLTTPIESKYRTIEQEERVFSPIYTNQPESLPKKSKTRIVYAFDKFTLSDNKMLSFVMTEVEGERTLTINLKPKYIIEAEPIR